MAVELDVLSIGFGNVGREVASRQRLEVLAHELGAETVRLTTLTTDPDKVLRDIYQDNRIEDGTHIVQSLGPNDRVKPDAYDLVYVATPSGQGETTYAQISPFFNNERDTVVVTAEKGAVTLFWEQLQPYIDDTLGISATVGGGSQLLHAARAQAQGGPVSRIDLVANGTLGVVMEEFGKGTSPHQVANITTRMGYAEPGSSGIKDIIDGELGDVVKKAQIFYNFVLATGTDYLESGEIDVPVLSEKDMHMLKNSGAGKRMVVTFARTNEYPELAEKNDDIGLSVTSLKSGWVIRISFADVSSDPILKPRLDIPGVDAACVMRTGRDGSDGIATLSAPGAGPNPTARAMTADAYRLITRHAA